MRVLLLKVKNFSFRMNWPCALLVYEIMRHVRGVERKDIPT